MNSEEAIRKLREDAEQVMSEWRSELPPSWEMPLINWNFRLTTTAGRHRKRSHIKRSEIDLNYNYYIQFGYDRAKATLMHELAHELDWVLYKKRGHSYSFKALCKKLNGTMNTAYGKGEFADCATTDYIPRNKMIKRYLYGCPCGKQWKRARRMKPGYICASCKGNITLKEDLL